MTIGVGGGSREVSSGIEKNATTIRMSATKSTASPTTIMVRAAPMR